MKKRVIKVTQTPKNPISKKSAKRKIVVKQEKKNTIFECVKVFTKNEKQIDHNMLIRRNRKISKLHLRQTCKNKTEKE